MRIIEVIQGSREWLDTRKKYRCASDAPVMMGASKKRKRDDLIKLMATGLEREISEWVQENLFDKGHEAEHAIHEHVESIVGQDLYKITAVDDAEYLLASFDGMTMNMVKEISEEHKLWNEELVASVRDGSFRDDPYYYWQFEHQIAVGGHDRLLFVVSDGTPDNCVYDWYEPVEGRREQLMAGWAQFDIDVANYQHAEVIPKAIGAPVKDLPAINYRLNGLALQSNLADYKAAALQLVEDSKLPLETDQDFADRETLCKSFKDAEDKLKNIREQVVGEVVDIDAFCKEVAHIAELIRQARLTSEKQIKTRKDQIRTDIVLKYNARFADFISEISATIAPLKLPSIATDFAGAIKGLKNLDSLGSACNDHLAALKIEANQLLNKIALNQKTLREEAKDYPFLFADAQQLVLKDNDDLKAVIANRINEHKAQEQAKEEAQREKIRQEELARIADEQRKAEELKQAEIAEQERIAAEQADLANKPNVESEKVQRDEPQEAEQPEPFSNSTPVKEFVNDVDNIALAESPTSADAIKMAFTRENVIAISAAYWDMGRVQTETYLIDFFTKPTGKKAK